MKLVYKPGVMNFVSLETAMNIFTFGVFLSSCKEQYFLICVVVCWSFTLTFRRLDCEFFYVNFIDGTNKNSELYVCPSCREENESVLVVMYVLYLNRLQTV